MHDLAERRSVGSTGKDGATTREVVNAGGEGSGRQGQIDEDGERDRGEEEERVRRWRVGRKKRKSHSHTHFRVYRRRWFGLAQLVLLNVVVSWDVSFSFPY